MGRGGSGGLHPTKWEDNPCLDLTPSYFTLGTGQAHLCTLTFNCLDKSVIRQLKKEATYFQHTVERNREEACASFAMQWSLKARTL